MLALFLLHVPVSTVQVPGAGRGGQGVAAARGLARPARRARAHRHVAAGLDRDLISDLTRVPALTWQLAWSPHTAAPRHGSRQTPGLCRQRAQSGHSQSVPQWPAGGWPRLTNNNINNNCEAQARVRQGSARDGSQGERPQSLNPCLELTLKLVATHPPNSCILNQTFKNLPPHCCQFPWPVECAGYTLCVIRCRQ